MLVAQVPPASGVVGSVLGMFIDGTWYVTVATVLTVGNRADVLRSMAHLIDGAMGVVMFLFAYILVGGY